jgi:hypothetical protein
MASYNKLYDEAAADDPIKKYGRLDLYPGDYGRDFVVKGVMHKKGDPFLLQPAEDGTVRITAKSWSVKPYLGVGYTGRLIKSRDDWKVSAALGVLIWGGAPTLKVSSDDINLVKDIKNVPGKKGDYVSKFKKLPVYPVINIGVVYHIL